jgi:hypothetical protein
MSAKGSFRFLAQGLTGARQEFLGITLARGDRPSLAQF